MSKLIIIIFLSVLTGCGTVASVRMNAPQIGKPSFKFLDYRPNEMRKSRVEVDSSGVTNFFADDNISPSVPDLITSTLQTELQNILTGHTVILDEFVMYVYEHKASVDTNQIHVPVAPTPEGYTVPLLAGLMIPSIDSIVGEKTVYVRISGKIDDQEYSTIVGDLYRGRVTERNIQTTLYKTLAQLTSDLQIIIAKNDV